MSEHDNQFSNNEPEVTIAPAIKKPSFDEVGMRRFLRYIVDPSIGCTEVRIIGGQYHSSNAIIPNTKYNSILSAWYDNIDDIVADASKLKGISGYICFNPASRDLLGRSYNRLSKVRANTRDEDVNLIRWAYVDVDSIRRPEISATNEELQFALDRRDRIARDHPEIRRASLGCRSGNGGFELIRLPDYPNDAEHRSLVGDLIDSLSATYSDDKAKIDEATRNPSRVGPLIGSFKCKGSHIPERPWRMTRLDWAGEARDGDLDPELEPFDIREWLAKNPSPSKTAPVATVTIPRVTAPPWESDRSHRIKRAAAYVDRMPSAVSGSGGHSTTFNVACALIKGFDLSVGEARPILDGYNARCQPPWAVHEIEHKLRSADEEPDGKARGYLADANRDEFRTPYTGPGAGFVIGEDIPGGPSSNGQATHGSSNGQPAGSPRPGKRPPIDADALTIRAKTFADKRAEDVYLDADFLRDLATLAMQDPARAVAIKTIIGRVDGVRPAALKEALSGFRKDGAKAGDPQAGGPGGGPGGPGKKPPGDDPRFRPENMPAFRATDMGNAELFSYAHGHQARYVKDYGEWMLNLGQRWAEDKESVAAQWAQEVPGLIACQIADGMSPEAIDEITTWQAKTESKERLAAVLAVAMANLTTTPARFDTDHMLFNVQNGTIDLRTGEFREHRPSDFITKISPVVYDPAARCPMWDRFVLEIMKDDPETVAYIRRIMGYAMTGNVKDHAVFICYGNGSNGKSVWLKACGEVLGDYSTNIDPEILMSQANAMHPTGLTDLEGRRLVVCEETDDRRGLAEAIIKRITGETPIRARKIGRDYYEFNPTHHIFMATNHLPAIHGNDHGIWRRLKLIPFEVQFDEKSGRKPDRDLADKLRLEYSGILNWFLAGLKDWQANGLKDSPTIVKATNAFREDSDTLGWFLEENATDRRADLDHTRNPRKTDPMAIFKAIYAEYKSWCDANGVKPMGTKKLGTQLNDRGFTTWKDGVTTWKLGLTLKVSDGTKAGYSVGGSAGDDDADQPGGSEAWEAGRFAYQGAGDESWADGRE